jgi:hypothetical protein
MIKESPKVNTEGKINYFSKLIVSSNKQVNLSSLNKLVLLQREFLELGKNYKQYLLENAPLLLGYKPLNYNLDVWALLDNKMNIPFHLACNYGNFNFINKLEESELIKKPLDEYMHSTNIELISAYAYIKNKSIVSEYVKKGKNKHFYYTPQIVFIINVEDPNNYSTINTILKFAQSDNLIINVVDSIQQNKVFITFDISEESFRKEAEIQKLKVKEINSNTSKEFEDSSEFIYSVEPFFSRHYQEVIYNKLNDSFDLNLLKKENVLSKVILMHKPNIQFKVFTLWFGGKWYFPNLFKNMFVKLFFEKEKYTYSEINTIYRYFGEKLAIYYAFSSFTVINLLPIVVVSLFMLAIYRERIFVTYIMFPTYSFLILLWSVFFTEKWKRKNKEIVQKWGVNDLSVKTEVRETFIGDEFYKSFQTKLEKYDLSNRYVISFLISLPIVVFLVGSIIVVFFFANKFEQKYQNTYLIKYIPSLVKSSFIVILNFLYNNLAYVFTENENHKYEESYENSLIVKLFLFRLVSELTAIFYVIFNRNDVEQLKSLIYMLFFVKCVSPYIRIIMSYLNFNRKFLLYFSNLTKLKSKENNNNSQTLNNKNLDNKNILNTSKSKDLSTNNNNFQHTAVDRLEEDYIINLNRVLSENKYSTKLSLERIKEEVEYSSKSINKKNPPIINLSASKLNEISKSFHNNQFNNESNNNNRKVKILNTSISNSTYMELSSDNLEINSMKQKRIAIIFLYADTILIIVIMILFSSIIPFAPIIFFLFLLVSLHLGLYTDIYNNELELSKKSYTIGLWTEILELTTIVSIIFNCFMLFYYNPNEFNEYYYIINGITRPDIIIEYNLKGYTKTLHIILLIEHIILFLRLIFVNYFSQMNFWVISQNFLLRLIEKERLQEKENLNNEKFRALLDESLEKLREEYNLEKQRNVLLTRNIDTQAKMIELYKEDLAKKNAVIRNNTYYNNIKNTNIMKNRTVISSNNFENEFSKLNFKLINNYDSILESIFKSIILGKQLVLDEEENNLKVSVNNILIFDTFKSTFVKIEKDILINKFNILMFNYKENFSFCTICNKNNAVFTCHDCKEDLFCKTCIQSHVANNIYSNHKNYVAWNLSNKKYLRNQTCNFPTSENSINCDNLKKIYLILYDEYVLKNAIQNNNTINLKHGIENKLKVYESIKSNKTIYSDNKVRLKIFELGYNPLELYYINRVFFSIVKLHGYNTSFQSLIECLRIMNSKLFEEKLKLVLKLLDESDQGLISKFNMESFLLVNFTNPYRKIYQTVVNSLYLNKESAKLRDLYQEILSTPHLKEIFMEILQIEN